MTNASTTTASASTPSTAPESGWARLRQLRAPIGLFVLLLAAPLVVSGFRGPAPWTVDSVEPPTDLPDLTMAPPSELSVEALSDGGFEIRFTSTMQNEGAGGVHIRADRDGPDASWAVTEAGDSVLGAAEMVWGGDGHDHWHLVGAAEYWLEDAALVDGAAQRDAARKVGFCIFDGSRLGQDGPFVFDPERDYRAIGCGRQESTALLMGLSPGWSDPYRSDLPGQSVDISGLAAGRYRIVAEVNPNGLLSEVDQANNVAWTEFDLSYDGETPVVQVTTTGP